MSMLKEVIIREVWAYNLEYEFNLILQAISEHHLIISMDTEFPGVIHSPKIDYRHLLPSDHYRYLKANVDDLKLIQVGLTLSDSEGNLPDFGTNNSYIWEFNFCDFDVNHDLCNQDSIDMLRRQGINFERNLFHGVDSKLFAELMFSSILVYNDFVTWVTFSSAYDFGYLVKILTGMNLPNLLEDFLKMVKVLFGKSVYDMKYMMKSCNSLYGGLERVATTLDVCRAVGNAHQAASDSLLTWHVFDKMIKTYFKDDEAAKHAGVLFGLEIIKRKSVIIREVWAYNLEYEFNLILQAISEHHLIISMDTEFPGVIHSPSVIHSPKIDYRHLLPSDHYRYLKANVDDLKLIQVGLTLSDSEGNLPDFGTNNSYIWEFNFCDFDVNHDLCNQDSIDMLRRQGINFERNLFHGVDSKLFAELMFSSILVYNDFVTWVTFSSAYDFGYLVKILTGMNLPNLLEDFLKMVEVLFGKSVYDMKYMMKSCNSLYGGLERVATTLDVCRAVGNAHQAASDSLLTWHVFDKMIKTYFKDDEAAKHAGVLFGLEIAA
ncbi:uncharacterized protein LOC127114237 [Lathyrus oleraceus]|uniref:uncharacterized protein LOC127114237 n=1 Tax=Pisum sativum TaxID=3888 RepID=UPI0021D3C853|nr:uncharacterized protein LOC127114237 [Pisum sativum]